jgi:hypothetical protein
MWGKAEVTGEVGAEALMVKEKISCDRESKKREKSQKLVGENTVQRWEG